MWDPFATVAGEVQRKKSSRQEITGLKKYKKEKFTVHRG
jgi:hypothetical protein